MAEADRPLRGQLEAAFYTTPQAEGPNGLLPAGLSFLIFFTGLALFIRALMRSTPAKKARTSSIGSIELPFSVDDEEQALITPKPTPNSAASHPPGTINTIESFRSSPNTVMESPAHVRDGESHEVRATRTRRIDPAVFPGASRLTGLLDGTIRPGCSAMPCKAARRVTPTPLITVLPKTATKPGNGVDRLEALLDGAFDPWRTLRAKPSRRVIPAPLAALVMDEPSLHAPPSDLNPMCAAELAAMQSPKLWRSEPVVVVAQPAVPKLGAPVALPADAMEAVHSAQATADAAIVAAGAVVAAKAVERGQEKKQRHASRRPPPTKQPALLRQTNTIYDAELHEAFVAADTDQTGVLSKRQLYAALARVDLAVSPSEQLQIWAHFDRDRDGKVEWAEFRALGAALLEVAEAAPKPKRTHGRPKAETGTFARREASDTHRMHFAAEKIQGLARRRSMKRVQKLAATKAV